MPPSNTNSNNSATSPSPSHIYSDKHNSFIYVVVVIAAIAGLLFGYDTGVISGALLYIREQFSLSTGMQEVVTSIVLLGAVIGAAFGGKSADKYGRRISLILSAIIFVVGALITAIAGSTDILILGRFVVGLAIGAASLCAPLYISEVAPKRIRGSLVCVNQLALTSGIVISYLVDYYFSESGSWRMMFGTAVIPGMILLVGMIFMPQSPRWLVSKGQIGKATSVLKKIRAVDEVQSEISDLHSSVKLQTGDWAALKASKLRPALWVGVGLAAFQQLTGINTVIYYSPTIFQSAGFSSSSHAILATTGLGVINIIFTLVATLLIDKVGRRPLLLIGTIIMVIALALLAIVFSSSSIGHETGTLAVIGLSLYIAAFAIGMGPVFWLMISEIYPVKVRGLAMGVCSIINWGTNLIVALTFLSLTKLLGTSGTFWLYAIIGIFAWIFFYKMVPETKGKTLEEIEDYWRTGKHPREIRK